MSSSTQSIGGEEGSQITRVGVYVDGWNLLKCGDAAAPDRAPVSIDLMVLARRLAAANGRGDDGELVEVFAALGIPPDGGYSPRMKGERQRALRLQRIRALRAKGCWEQMGVIVKSRDYCGSSEVGADGDVGLAAFFAVRESRCNVAVIVSADDDLAPAVEHIFQIDVRGVETASWKGDGLKPMPLNHANMKRREGKRGGQNTRGGRGSKRPSLRDLIIAHELRVQDFWLP